MPRAARGATRRAAGSPPASATPAVRPARRRAARSGRKTSHDPALAAHGGRHLREVLSGLELFQRVASGELPHAPLVTLLGFRLVEASRGRVVFTADPREEYYNGIGVVHGGWTAALLDSALGCAVNTMMPAGRVFATLELTVNLTRPLDRRVGRVRCIATVLHVGSRTATAEARVVDQRGKLYAHGTTTCMLVEAPR